MVTIFYDLMKSNDRLNNTSWVNGAEANLCAGKETCNLIIPFSDANPEEAVFSGAPIKVQYKCFSYPGDVREDVERQLAQEFFVEEFKAEGRYPHQSATARIDCSKRVPKQPPGPPPRQPPMSSRNTGITIKRAVAITRCTNGKEPTLDADFTREMGTQCNDLRTCNFAKYQIPFVAYPGCAEQRFEIDWTCPGGATQTRTGATRADSVVPTSPHRSVFVTNIDCPLPTSDTSATAGGGARPSTPDFEGKIFIHGATFTLPSIREPSRTVPSTFWRANAVSAVCHGKQSCEYFFELQEALPNAVVNSNVEYSCSAFELKQRRTAPVTGRMNAQRQLKLSLACPKNDWQVEGLKAAQGVSLCSNDDVPAVRVQSLGAPTSDAFSTQCVGQSRGCFGDLIQVPAGVYYSPPQTLGFRRLTVIRPLRKGGCDEYLVFKYTCKNPLYDSLPIGQRVRYRGMSRAVLNFRGGRTDISMRSFS